MTVDVFITSVAEAREASLLERYDALLSEEERAREGRFVFVHDRERYRVTRALVRTVLGQEVGRAPRELSFEANEHGRPYLAPGQGQGRELSFNLSHTRDTIALALVRRGIVGIDIEDRTRSGNTVEIADRFFSAREVEALHERPASERRDRFFVYWTLKEAYIKARGMGLAIPLDSFGFVLDEGAPRLWTEPRCGDPLEDWTFGVFAPSPDHVLALALTGAPLAPTFYRELPLASRDRIQVPHLPGTG